MKKLCILAVFALFTLTACGGGSSSGGGGDGYQVSFDTDGGSAVAPITNVTSIDAPTPEPTKDGQLFRGWFDNAGFNGNRISFPYAVTQDTTLYAKWALPINTREDLANISNDLDGHYVLTQDISLTGASWTPIGSTSEHFTGTFDGNGFKITGMTINDNSLNYAGLFVVATDATIDNLALEDIDIDITASVQVFIAGIAVVAIDTDINNSYVTGNIDVLTSQDLLVGGIVVQTSGSTIISSHSAVDIIAKADTGSVAVQAGGIAAQILDATITASYNSGEISVTSDFPYAGGIAAQVIQSNGLTTITNSYNSGDIDVTAATSADGGGVIAHAGGIIAATYSGETTIKNSYNSGKIAVETGRSIAAGGIVAGNDSALTIMNSYNIGDLFAETALNAAVVAGIFADNDGDGYVTVINSYSTGNITGVGFRAYFAGIFGLNDLQYAQNATVDGTVAMSSTINSSVVDNGGGVGRIAAVNDFKTPVKGNYASDSMATLGMPFNISGIGAGTSKTEAELKQRATYEGLGWAFGNTDDNPWVIDEGNTYPRLYWE
jgi:uncharacterized repeat protein (TIGR02543 family)